MNIAATVPSFSLRALLRTAAAFVVLSASALMTAQAADVPASGTGTAAAQGAAPTVTNNPRVRFETSLGNFTVELYPEKAPKTVANFIQYVADKHYDGTIFHRVIRGFMVQGGGFTPDMTQKPTRAPVVSESKNTLGNVRGSIAMARTSDPDSATAQFFINTVNNRSLNYPSPDGYGYTVFGRVIDGMDTIDKIEIARTGNVGGMGDVPVTPVIIQRATLVSGTGK
ncbi:peptidylprolyl isomerase [Uliginosibacterium sp. sgz301328]|uniref:peptidylprolyl isomerase n=1 Tax=Uliginosibacterium sp. sgz301328 TaxID=3243764 RepID=UPI00359DEE06